MLRRSAHTHTCTEHKQQRVQPLVFPFAWQASLRPPKAVQSLLLAIMQYRARMVKRRGAFMPIPQDRKRSLKESEGAMLDIMRRDPDDTRAYVALGTSYLQQKRIAEARQIFLEACRASTGADAFVWTAMADLERRVRYHTAFLFECALLRGAVMCWSCRGTGAVRVVADMQRSCAAGRAGLVKRARAMLCTD